MKDKELKTFEQALKDANVGDTLVIHAKDRSVEYILELKAKEIRDEGVFNSR